MGRFGLSRNLFAICLVSSLGYQLPPATGQYTATNLVQLRALSSGALSDSTITLSPTGGDPHPVTGVVTPGEYWINGDHISDPTNSQPIFLELSGSGNTYDLSGATIKLDTRDLGDFGRNLGHESAVRPLRVSGSGNSVQGLSLIGVDLALDTDPDAKRHADWGSTFVQFSGDNNSLTDAHIVTRGSTPYGLGDAFGKGNSQGMAPYVGHRKMAGIQVHEATNAYFNNIDLDIYTYGHGVFIQKSSDTTFENSTITGELFSSQNVIDHELYQQYGHTWWGGPIPEDIMISGAEDGFRAYGVIDGVPVENITARNVVITNMRTGFATAIAKGDILLENVESYGAEANFAVGSNHTIINAKGDITNGPLFNGPSTSISNTTVDVELVGDVPVGIDWTVGYITGDNVNVTVSSDLPAGALPEGSYVRLGQQDFQDWRFYQVTNPDNPSYDLKNSSFTNNTNQILHMGSEVEGNVGSSQAPVISNGKENYYDGVTLVPSGSRLVVQHRYGLGNDGTEVDAEFSGNNVVFNGTATASTPDDNGTVVEAGATLEIEPGVQVDDERVTISGHGVDGKGAIYTDGTVDSGTRLVGSGEIIMLDGDASIGVGIAGNQFLVDRVAGVGNLTKLGPGKLSVETSSVFDGDLIVAEGELVGRRRVVHSNLTVNAGATVSALANWMIETPNGLVTLNGTFNANVRMDDSVIPARLGALEGNASGLVTSSNPSSEVSANLQIVGESGSADFQGRIEGAVSIAKWGDGTQILSGANTYSGTTSISGGTLLVNGSHSGGASYTIAGGTLGGHGSIDADITVESGGTLAPGASAGQLTVEQIVFETGSTLEIEIGGLIAGSEYDQLLADSVTLAGDLAVSLLDLGSGLYFPGPSDRFTVLGATTLSGLFGNVANGVRLDTAGGEGSFLVTYDGVSDVVILSDFALSTSPGDFDADGDVDGTDFLFWQRNGLSTAELLDWQSHYGQLSSLSATAAVPEPTTLMLALAVPSLNIARRRR